MKVTPGSQQTAWRLKEDYTRGAIPFSFLAVCLAAPPAWGTQSQIGVYSNIRPGSSLKAEVDLNLGEPLRKLDEYTYEYAPPRGVPDTQRVVATFFPDTRKVSRLDVYLKAPADPEMLRSDFGTRVMARNREDGKFEELFFPKLHAVMFAGNGGSAPVAAIGYISPRLMADYFAERAQDLLRENRYDEAQTEADKAVLVAPDYARGYIEQGECWIGRKNYNEAIVSLIAGTNAEYPPKYVAVAHARLGTLYWREKNWTDKARPEFQKALTLASNLDEVHFRHGEFLQAQKQTNDAIAELETAVELNSRNAEARAALGALYRSQSDYVKALPQYAELSTWVESGELSWSDRDNAIILYHYGVSLRKTNQVREAVEALRKAVQRNPKLVAGWVQLGYAYELTGDFAKAIDSYRTGLNLDPNHFGLNHGLGVALLESGQTDAAWRQMESTLRLKPGDPVARFDMARCWGAMGKKKQTIYWAEQAVAVGYKNRARLTSDPFLAKVQKNGDFKKILEQIQP